MNHEKRYKFKQFNSPNLKGGGITGTSKSELEHEPVQAENLEVIVSGNFDRALKAFRALVQKERILSLFKEKQSYEKPSDKKRRKYNEQKRKLLELDMKDDNPRFKKREEEYSE